MRGRLGANRFSEAQPLHGGWRFASCAPGACSSPTEAEDAGLDWSATTAPCTVASALRDLGQWDLDRPARRFDDDDWWFHTTFRVDPTRSRDSLWLCFDGLASSADLWVNDVSLGTIDGMFTAHERALDDIPLQAENTLVIRFRSLTALLGQKRPRPRWRAPMIEQQQLRWHRTTLLGRTPGWSPSAAAVGPWRPIRLEYRERVTLTDLHIRAEADGSLSVAVSAEASGRDRVDAVAITLSRGDTQRRVALEQSSDGRYATETRLDGIEPWWPHTHGTPALYDAVLEITVGGATQTVPIGAIGFRTVEVDQTDGDFAVRINGLAVFCRGACWTPLDVVRLDADAAALDDAFRQIVSSGMNMLRVCGTMTYESDAFLDHCDRAGVMLWHDLMFANMDYPEDDPQFVDGATTEVRQQLARLQGRPSVVVVCGNSEGEQQAAMWGAANALWAPALFHERFAALSRAALPGVAYWPSSAHGGAFPHAADTGTTSYYGVGAYLRPMSDARLARLRFATECLAFANIPEDATLARLTETGAPRMHHPAWKARTPRDLGAGWDFDDVRDHYVGTLFGVDPAALRYADHARYLDLGRMTSGEVMAATFLEWRRHGSTTRGALIWFLRDLWRGAGWGVVDADGVPKVAWHYLRRALAPRAVSISDEGVNGLTIHCINDAPEPWTHTLELSLFRQGEIRTGSGTRSIEVPGRSTIAIPAAELLEGFHDLSYAYRFGPPTHELVHVLARDATSGSGPGAFHFIGTLPHRREIDVGLSATVIEDADGGVLLDVASRRFAQCVRVSVPGYACEDDAFHLAPGQTRRLALHGRRATGAPIVGTVRAMNSEAVVKVRAP